MKSVTSYFKISSAVIRDDFRRFWALPVIAFLFYFFSTVFYIIMNLKYIDDEYSGMARFIDSALSGQYIPNLVNIIWISVLSVLLVFRYLHSSGHTVAVHSMPFTRAELLNSHTVSCILFSALPILLTGLILLVIAQPCYYPQDSYMSADDMVNVFARSNVIRWMLHSFICSLFIMFVAAASGMVTGTAFHHTVAALGFNAIIPACLGITMLYGDIYLYGFTMPTWFEDAMFHLSPVIAAGLGKMTGGLCIYYIAVIILLYALTMFLYYRRKLERATEGIVFRAVDIIVTLIFGFLGMTGLGMTFYGMFDESKAMSVIGYAAGAVMGIIIIKMIILKTVKVFTKRTAAITGVYAVMALIFFACLNFNVTGYETRIPDAQDGVEISVGYDGFGYDNGVLNNTGYEEEETIEAVKAVHNMIIDHKKLCRDIINKNNHGGGSYEDTVDVYINYYVYDDGVSDDAESKRTIESRRYTFPAYILMGSAELDRLAGCSELADSAVESLPDLKSVSYVNIVSGMFDGRSPYGTSEESVLCSDPEKTAGLYDALEKDLRSLSGDVLRESYNVPITARISIMYTENDDNAAAAAAEANTDVVTDSVGKVSGYRISQYDMTLDIHLTLAYRNTMEWLRENGYGDVVKYNYDYWKFAEVYELNPEDSVSETYSRDYESRNVIPASSDGMTVVTDPEKLALLYGNCYSHVKYGPAEDLSTDEDNIYLVKFYYQEEDSDDYFCGYVAYTEGRYVKAAAGI